MQEWRESRTYTALQSDLTDFLLRDGIYSGEGEKHRVAIATGRFDGKSYWLRSLAFELTLALRLTGVEKPIGLLCGASMPRIEDTHVAHMQREYNGIGKVFLSRAEGLHVQWDEGGRLYMSGPSQRIRSIEPDFLLIDHAEEVGQVGIRDLLYLVNRRPSEFPVVAIAGSHCPDLSLPPEVAVRRVDWDLKNLKGPGLSGSWDK